MFCAKLLGMVRKSEKYFGKKRRGKIDTDNRWWSWGLIKIGWAGSGCRGYVSENSFDVDALMYIQFNFNPVTAWCKGICRVNVLKQGWAYFWNNGDPDTCILVCYCLCLETSLGEYLVVFIPFRGSYGSSVTYVWPAHAVWLVNGSDSWRYALGIAFLSTHRLPFIPGSAPWRLLSSIIIGV